METNRQTKDEKNATTYIQILELHTVIQNQQLKPSLYISSIFMHQQRDMFVLDCNETAYFSFALNHTYIMGRRLTKCRAKCH